MVEETTCGYDRACMYIEGRKLKTNAPISKSSRLRANQTPSADPYHINPTELVFVHFTINTIVATSLVCRYATTELTAAG